MQELMCSQAPSPHQVQLTGELRLREKSECRVIGETEELMEEGDIVLLSNGRRGARRITA
jgi:hypothetical protein